MNVDFVRVNLYWQEVLYVYMINPECWVELIVSGSSSTGVLNSNRLTKIYLLIGFNTLDQIKAIEIVFWPSGRETPD